MAANGTDPARGLPIAIGRLYNQTYGTTASPVGMLAQGHYDDGRPGVYAHGANRHLVTFINTKQNVHLPALIDDVETDEIFRALRGDTGVVWAVDELMEGRDQEVTTHNTSYMTKAKYIGGMALAGAVGGAILGPMIGVCYGVSAIAGATLGLVGAATADQRYHFGEEDITTDTKEFTTYSEALRDQNNSLAIEVEVNPAGNYTINTYNYMPETDTDDEKYTPLHVINVQPDARTGVPNVTNCVIRKLGGGVGLPDLKVAYESVVKTLRGLRSSIDKEYVNLHKGYSELQKAQAMPQTTAQNRLDRNAAIVAAQQKITDARLKIFELTRKFDVLFGQVADPIARYIDTQDLIDMKGPEKRKAELGTLLHEAHEKHIPHFTKIPNARHLPNAQYSRLITDDYAKAVRHFQHEGQVAAPDAKYKVLLDHVVRLREAERDIGTLAGDPNILAHVQRDEQIIRPLFQGETLAQLDARLNATPAFQLPNQPANYQAHAARYLDGSGDSYAPVIFAFRDDITNGRDPNTNRFLPNIDGPLTELKDTFYYDHIPPQMKTFMDKFYAAFKEYRAEIQEQRALNAAATREAGFFGKVWAALLRRNRGNQPEDSAEMLMMRQIFGTVDDHAPRRGRRAAPGPAVPPPADPFAAIFMAIMNS